MEVLEVLGDVRTTHRNRIFQDWLNNRFVQHKKRFPFSSVAHKNCRISGFGILSGLRVFFNLVNFSFLSIIMAVFSNFLSSAFDDFSGFSKEVTPCSRAKTVSPRDLLYSILPRLSFRGMNEHSLISSRCLSRDGCQADYEELKIISKQKTISQRGQNR